MSSYVLNEPLCDWLTLTTYDETVFHYWWSKYLNFFEFTENARHRVKALMQYEGEETASEEGTFWVGEGEQQQRKHFMVRISGQLADQFLKTASKQVAEGHLRCTRLDLQITIQEPDTWSQIRLFNEQKSKGKTMGFVSSNDKVVGEMATVYIGSRTSQRFSRTYQKKDRDNNRLLRWEMEYKSDRSQAIMRMMGNGQTTKSKVLLADLNRIGDKKMVLHFADHLGNDQTVVRVKRETDDDRTKRWLLQSVLPAFTRHISKHGQDSEVLSLFLYEIERVDNKM